MASFASSSRFGKKIVSFVSSARFGELVRKNKAKKRLENAYLGEIEQVTKPKNVSKTPILGK